MPHVSAIYMAISVTNAGIQIHKKTSILSCLVMFRVSFFVFRFSMSALIIPHSATAKPYPMSGQDCSMTPAVAASNMI